MLRIRLILCALLLSVTTAHANIDNAGTTAGNFLSVGTGAGILSMAGASIGGGHDLNAAAWNPAALASVNGSQFSLAHASLNAQTSQEWLSAGGRAGNSSLRWGAGLLYQSEGSFDGTDASGNSTGSFNVSNTAFGASVARPFGDAVLLGAGLRYVNEKLGDASGSGLGFDLGLQAHAGDFGFGLAGRNLGGKMKYDSGSYDLPSVIGFGAAWSNPASGLRFALDANFPHAYYNDVRFGAEWMWQERLALRGGYRMELNAPAGEPLGGPTFGFGAGVGGMWLDYAFLAGQSEAQGQHRFGLTFRPGMLMHGASPLGANDGARGNAAPAAPTAPAPVDRTAVAKAEPVKVTPTAQAVQPAPVAATKLGPAKSDDAPPLKNDIKTGYVPALVAEGVAAAPAAPVAPVAVAAPAKPEPPAPVFALLHSEDASAPVIAPRANDSNVRRMAPTKPVRVPKLIVERPAPVAAAVVKTPKVAPVAAAAPAVVPDMPASRPSAPANADGGTQLAGTKPSIEVVVPPAPAPASAPKVVNAPAPPAQAAKPAAPAAPAPRPSTVTIANGITLAQLAKQYDTSVAAIMMENNLVTENVKNGTKLKLPPAGRH